MADDGRLIRLFPVPFRLVEDDQQFRKWQWITARVRRAQDDARPESHRVSVDTIEVEAGAKGETAFSWDGIKANGERAAAGAYSIKATHTASDGTGTALNTYVDATVDSVTIGSDGLYLNLPGLGTAPLDYVLRIGKSAT